MNYRFKCILFAVACMAMTPIFLARADDTNNFILNHKLAFADSREVYEVHILSLPADTESVVSISPEQLESNYLSKIVIRRFRGTAFKKALLSHLKSSDFRLSTEHPGDILWACIFYAEDGRKILSVYSDYFGRGKVDDLTVSSNGNLVSFLKSRFTIE